MKATKVDRSKSSGKGVSKKDISETRSAAKKLGVSWIVVVLCIVVGALGGYFGSWLITKNDTYQMVAYADGNTDVYIGPEEDNKFYVELGVKCVAFGKDVSKDFKVKYFFRADLTEKEVEVDKVDESKDGIYYAVYTAPSAKYSSVKLIRNIFVVKEEDNG